MKRLLLIATLMTVGVQGLLYAQNEAPQTETERTFSIQRTNAYQHTVHLERNEKIVVELGTNRDYALLKNPDSLLNILWNDIAFYQDSVNATEHVSVDYVIGINTSRKEMRFKKYKPDGDIYIKQHEDLAKLKLEQDTVRLTLKYIDSKERISTYSYVQITFYLNNLANLQPIVHDKELITTSIHLLDSAANYTTKFERMLDYTAAPSTIDYYPYTQDKHLNKYKSEESKDIRNDGTLRSHGTLTAAADWGISVIRNTIVPTPHVYFEYYRPWKDGYSFNKKIQTAAFYRLSLSSYLFFDKNSSGDFIVSGATFANIELGHYTRQPGKETRSRYVGIGYLLPPKTNYFKNTTMMLSFNREIFDNISISAELIFTNNFKQMIPALTLRVGF